MTDKEMAGEYLKDDSKWLIEDCEGNLINITKKVEEAFLAGLKVGRPEWHKLNEKYPEADKLVRVRLMSEMEHICETCYYEPTEDEIGFGKLVINFYELNGEWVDDNDIIAWCEIPKYTEE